MNKYGLHGVLKAKKSKGDEMASILLDASKLVGKAKGCSLYIVSRDSQNPDNIWVTEVWETKGDHDNSLKNPSVRALISKVMPLLGGTPETGQEFQILGGHGLE